jgi:N6-adenosine-specific RNA methylase IME4
MSELARYDAACADDWAARILACWRQSIDGILSAGRLIAEAKAALPHGEFLSMVSDKLPFDIRTAQRLMAIAADPRLSNATHAPHLPAAWGTLYELTKLDDESFEARIADGTIRPDMQRNDISGAIKKQKRETREKILGGIQCAMPTKKYGVIVEDFEWDHQTWSELGRDRAAENHYPVAKDAHAAAEIVERTKERFECAAPDCVLWMWTTLQHAAIAMDVLRLRGFEYCSQYAWHKDKIGLGYWSRSKHEILLIGVKGNIPCPAPGTQWPSIILSPRDEHSAKPECFLEMIEGYFPSLPKIELNRRGPPRPGWDAWGNEATGEIIEQEGIGANANMPTSEPAPCLSPGAGSPIQDFEPIPQFLRRTLG